MQQKVSSSGHGSVFRDGQRHVDELSTVNLPAFVTSMMVDCESVAQIQRNIYCVKILECFFFLENSLHLTPTGNVRANVPQVLC
jgi:hypothetical protein